MLKRKQEGGEPRDTTDTDIGANTFSKHSTIAVVTKLTLTSIVSIAYPAQYNASPGSLTITPSIHLFYSRSHLAEAPMFAMFGLVHPQITSIRH